MLRPHAGGRPGDAVPLQVREEDVLLPLEVLLRLLDERGQALEPLAVRSAALSTGQAHRGTPGLLDAHQYLGVLLHQRMYGVAGHLQQCLLVLGDVGHVPHVGLAQGHHVIAGPSLPGQLLFRLLDLERVEGLHEPAVGGLLDVLDALPQLPDERSQLTFEVPARLDAHSFHEELVAASPTSVFGPVPGAEMKK